ncbi:MAG: hypothetical protein KF746_13470 [Chitinophagaceae bacterium]|nr:hypothetical protein [Chitinophagaceae bacterium]
MYSKQKTTTKKPAPVKTGWHCTVTLLLMLFSVHTASAQMNFAELDKKMSEEKKYIVVYIGSKYCTYCLMQEAQIKKNNALGQKLDSAFYFVKGLAEADSAIVFNHKHYLNPNPQNPYQVNDFVTVYGKNEKGFVSYPLWLYFDKDYRLLLRFYGLMPPKNILKVLDRIAAVMDKDKNA